MRIYLPSILLVFVSGLSMTVPLTQLPGSKNFSFSSSPAISFKNDLFTYVSARTTMVMTSLLTLTAMFGSLSILTPQISYTAKLDNWMVICIIFVFSPLIELICALSLKNLNQEDTNWNHGNRVSPNGKSRMEPPEWNFLCDSKFNISAKNVDNISLFCYFFSFSVVNAFYWSDLLSKHHNFR